MSVRHSTVHRPPVTMVTDHGLVEHDHDVDWSLGEAHDELDSAHSSSMTLPSSADSLDPSEHYFESMELGLVADSRGRLAGNTIASNPASATTAEELNSKVFSNRQGVSASAPFLPMKLMSGAQGLLHGGDEKCRLLDLPEELLVAVLMLLRPRELGALAATCWRLRALVSGERSLRRPLVGLPERYRLFRPRIPLSALESQPQAAHCSNIVLDYLQDEGFFFISLEPEDAITVRQFTKCAENFMKNVDQKKTGQRKKMLYSKNAKRCLDPVGYAEMDEMHGYLTRRHRKKKFPWPKANKKEKELAHQYYRIMIRIVIGLLRNIAESLQIAPETLVSLLEADPPTDIKEAWLRDHVPDKHSKKAKLVDIGRTFSRTKSEDDSLGSEWDQPVLKMFHFREGHPIRANFRTMHEYSRGLFKLVTAFNEGATPCGMQMLMPRSPRASHRNFLPIFKLAQENDICVFAGFSLSKLCQVLAGSAMGIRPIYLSANVGYDNSAKASGSTFLQFDAHVSYSLLYQCIGSVAAARGMMWANPNPGDRLQRSANREFFNRKNPFGAFWFRSLSKQENQQNQKRVRWVVLGGAVAAVAVPLLVVARSLWVPVGGMAWIIRERARSEAQQS